MNCPRCEEPVEEGASFCGNCGLDLRQPAPGQPDKSAAEPPASAPVPPAEGADGQSPMVTAPLPSYALPGQAESQGEGKAVTGLVLGVLSVPGAVVPILGMLLAITGLILGTTSRRLSRNTLPNLAVGFSCLGILLSVGSLSYVVQHKGQGTNNQTAASRYAQHGSNAPAGDAVITSGSRLDTLCYRVDLPELSNIENANGSCTARAFNADTMVASSKIFTVDSARQTNINQANFASVAKQLVDNYASNNLPGFTITSQKIGTFAESPAYYVDASNTANTTMEMAIVLHGAPDGENIFVLVHGLDKGQADVRQLEETWEWK